MKATIGLCMSAIVHRLECIHAAVKASTLLLGFGIGNEGKVYLVDIGLACRYTQNGKHKKYKEDLRKALPGVDGGTHPCVMPTPRQPPATPVHLHKTPPTAKLQGDMDVLFNFKVTVES
ncbi:hypothetical protein MTO96_024942 [Rhipicephalus appendiculatus]